jgi:hypothetical protein
VSYLSGALSASIVFIYLLGAGCGFFSPLVATDSPSHDLNHDLLLSIEFLFTSVVVTSFAVQWLVVSL